MDRTVSIVPVDKRPYRVIAQENWGLTKEQMKGRHVHHRIPRSKGGTDDPSNLYVCTPEYHQKVWHAEDGYNSLIPFAHKGARLGASIGGTRSHSARTDDGKSLLALRWNRILHADRDEKGRSRHALRSLRANNSQKNEQGKSVNAVKGGIIGGAKGGKKGSKTTNAQKWMCLVTGKVLPPGPLTNWQRRRNIDVSLRVRI